MLRIKFIRFSVLLFCALMFFGPFTAHVFAQLKQSGVIEGRILNADQRPEENVVVVLVPSEKQTISDDNGYFQFRNISYGEYTISVKSLGVTADPVSVELNGEKVSVGNIQLKENATVLERVIVSSSYRHVNKNSVQVARLPLTYIENPQNYAVSPDRVFSQQIHQDDPA